MRMFEKKYYWAKLKGVKNPKKEIIQVWGETVSTIGEDVNGFTVDYELIKPVLESDLDGELEKLFLLKGERNFIKKSFFGSGTPAPVFTIATMLLSFLSGESTCYAKNGFVTAEYLPTKKNIKLLRDYLYKKDGLIPIDTLREKLDQVNK